MVDGKTLYLDEVSGDWVSKGELKKLKKLRKKEEAAAQKATAKAKKELEKKAKVD